MKMALIGFGRLGSHLSQFLKEHFDIMVFDKDISKKKQVIERGFEWCSDIEKVEEADIVVPFVPISSFETTIKEIAPNLKQGSLVVDVCSVKVLPVTCMKEYLPSHIQILATHPMFGPDSSEKTLFGQKIVLCPIRIQDEFYKDISQFLNKFGLKVIQSTPEEHDHQIANTLLLSHLIGRTLLDFGAKKFDIDTLGYRRLLKILGTVENDSWQLFEDMNRYNPYAKEMREQFQKSIGTVVDKIK